VAPTTAAVSSTLRTASDNRVARATTASRTVLGKVWLPAASTAVVSDQRWLSRYFWYLGRHDDAHRFAAAAVDALEPFGPGGDLAMAYSDLSQLQMLGGDTEDALIWGRLALDDAVAVGPPRGPR
jgi:hypothetical protein